METIRVRRPCLAALTWGVRWRRYLGVVLAALLASACSVVPVIYDNAPFLAARQLDGYLDLTSAQMAALDRDLSALHAWHRQTELRRYAALLRRVAAGVNGGLADDDVAAFELEARARGQALIERLLPAVANTLLSADDEQVERLVAKLERDRAAAVRRAARYTTERARRRFAESMRERVDDVFGDVGSAQETLIEAAASARADVDVAWRTYHDDWQLEFVELLRARHTDPAGFRIALQTLVRDRERNFPSELARLDAQNDAITRRLLVDVVGLADAEQRAHAVAWFERYAALCERLADRA